MDSHPGLVAQQEVDGALGKDQESEAKIAAAKAAVAASEQQLQVAQANEHKARTFLSYTQITAPFRGVITKRYADTGAMIQQGTASHTQAMPLVRLAQNDVLRLVIPVPESVVPRVRLGESVEVTVAALNRSYRGRVARISGQLDLDTRTMHTEVDVPNPDLVLVPGMYATVRLPLDQRNGALAVPVQAIGREAGKATVLSVGGDGRIEERLVQLGLETADSVEVVAGLQENDLVVVGDRGSLKSGEQVHPKIVTGRK
jgi:RND family efflux transporter MFP subunit